MSHQSPYVSEYRVDWNLTQDSRIQTTPLFIYPETFVPHEVTHSSSHSLNQEEQGKLEELKNDVLSILSNTFISHNQVSRVLGSEDNQIESQNGHEHSVIMRPVFLGRVTDQIRQILQADDLETFKAGLRLLIPEIDLTAGEQPLIAEAAKRFGTRGLPANYMNVFFVEDPNEILLHLPVERRQWFNRFLMSKYGDMRHLTVPFKNDRGRYQASYAMLSTLEGGVPILPFDDIAKRLMIIASAEHVSPAKTVDPNGNRIPTEIWARLPLVQAIIQLGRTLGKQHVNGLSPQIAIPDLVRPGIGGERSKLAKFNEMIARFSTMGEGAIMALQFRSLLADLDLESRIFFDTLFSKLPDPFDQILPIVTGSGQMGVLKTNLVPRNLVPGYPTRDGKIYLFPTDDGEQTVWSVEGPEFTFPLLTLPVGLFAGIAHLHRLPIISQEVSHRAVLLSNYNDYKLQIDPPYPCSSAGMFDQSMRMITEAIRLKILHPSIEIAFGELGNHGTHAIHLGNPLTAFRSFTDMLERGQIVLSPNVRQF